MFLLRQRSSASAARRPIAGGAWSLGSGAALTSHQHFPVALRVDEVTPAAPLLPHTHTHTQQCMLGRLIHSPPSPGPGVYLLPVGGAAASAVARRGRPPPAAGCPLSRVQRLLPPVEVPRPASRLGHRQEGGAD